MSHGDTVVDGDGIEFGGIAAHGLYLLLDDLSDFMQMGMSRHKLGERIDHCDDGFAELFTLHTCGDPECSGSCHSSSFRADCTSQLVFHICIFFFIFAD